MRAPLLNKLQNNSIIRITWFVTFILFVFIIAGALFLIKGKKDYALWVMISLGDTWKAHLAKLAVEGVSKVYYTSLVIQNETRVSPMDGMRQVYIPEGEFVMGVQKENYSAPAHKVYLDAFWIDMTEVSNEMYARCVKAAICKQPALSYLSESHYGDETYGNHPVVYVNWLQASAYCQWVGRRLPTEAEWEKAARGTDDRPYPWGKDHPDARLLNFDNMIATTTPVYWFPFGASPYGALNMAGNVREWVWDWYADDYYQNSPYQNPLGPEEGEKRSLRGGSFTDISRRVRADNRLSHDPYSPGYNRGFRCAVSP
jgi:formylglycine-generating enzyme required for sulfatase activity